MNRDPLAANNEGKCKRFNLRGAIITMVALAALISYLKSYSAIKKAAAIRDFHQPEIQDKESALLFMNNVSETGDANSNENSGYTRPFLEQKYSSSIECMLALEKTQYSMVDEWFQQGVPMLESVRTFGGYHYVLMGTLSGPDIKQLKSNWYCGSTAPSERYMATVHSRPRASTIIVIKCPGTKNITHIWPSVPAKRTGVTPFYNLQHFQTCDKLQKQEYMSAHGHDVSVDVKIGGCLISRGEAGRNGMPEWIAYHRLIGYRHFWIYMNEAWDSSGLPELPYVTYVPFNYVLPHHNNTKAIPLTKKGFVPHIVRVHRQNGMQMDCLYKSKQLGLDWITTTDTDEFIHVRDSNATTSSVLDYPLRNFLRQVDKHKVAALALNGIRYGTKNVGIDKIPRPRLRLDHVWRKEGNISSLEVKTPKMIYNVKLAQNLHIHGLWSPSNGTKNLFPGNEVHTQHYKNPNEDVYRNKGQSLVQDTDLRDRYRSQVLSMMRTFPTRNETAMS